jgi:hypothetical protein
VKRTIGHVTAQWASERCNVLLYCHKCMTQEGTVSINPVDIEAKIDRFCAEHAGCTDEE